MDSLKGSLLKCATASVTLVMHCTTFSCLSLLQVSTLIWGESKEKARLD